MRKFLALLMALTMMLSLAAPVMASGEASGDVVEDTGPKAAIVLRDGGEVSEEEQPDNFELTFFAGGAKTAAGVSGFLFTSPASETAFLFSEPLEDAGVFTPWAAAMPT